MDDRLVVGYDGSQESEVAVRWAATEARTRGSALDVVHVWGLIEPGRTGAGGSRATVLAHVHAIAEEGVTYAREAAPGVAARAFVANGPPAPVLVDCAKGARTIVLGRHGSGRLSRARLGSVSAGVLHHAPCPVAVVPDQIRVHLSQAPVVVGFDGSPGAFGALEAACDHARVHGVDVTVVTAWTTTGDVFSVPYWVSAYPSRSPTEVALEEAERVSRRAEHWAGSRHDVSFTFEVVEGRPADALVRRSRRAAVVVVGTRGRGGFTSLMLGSTSHALVQRATCPVIVTRLTLPSRPVDAPIEVHELTPA